MKPEQTELKSERRRISRSLQLCLMFLPLVMVGVGCKQDLKVIDASNPVGTYALVSVDGNKVPCTVQHEGHTLAVRSGTFMINSNGTCSSTMVFGPPLGGDTTREVKATYTRQGSKLTMRWEGAGMTTGLVVGDTFTMNNEGMVLAYHK